MDLIFVLSFVLIVFFVVYIVVYIDLTRRMKYSESRVVDIFLEKLSKVPAVIEVMRPYIIDDKKAFQLITQLHTEAIIHDYGTIPMLSTDFLCVFLWQFQNFKRIRILSIFVILLCRTIEWWKKSLLLLIF